MTAPTPPEVREAAVGNAILRAVLGDTDGGLVLDGDLPAAEIARLIVEHGAAAAVAAYRATQDGGAEDDACVVCGYPLAEHQGDGEMVHDYRAAPAAQDGGAEEAVRRVEAVALWLLAKYPDTYEDDNRSEQRDATDLLAALAPQAGDGAR